ncbi:hypothetical protein DPMN_048976 [Dreissena polymorpha]|uniref:Secreted protein n=1 Tax=Dreissena polymorpha TaxID=45954 RepID=A0A9D4I2T8_DREPO|nr:hypothetical protein DPMN_048976 [Dreissena polymorpha]
MLIILYFTLLHKAWFSQSVTQLDCTFPLAAINLNPHAHGTESLAKRDEPDTAANDGGSNLSHLRQVRVLIALEQLKEIQIMSGAAC